VIQPRVRYGERCSDRPDQPSRGRKGRLNTWLRSRARELAFTSWSTSTAIRALGCGWHSYEDQTAQCLYRSCTSTYHTVQPLHVLFSNCQPSHLYEGRRAAGWVVADLTPTPRGPEGEVSNHPAGKSTND